MSVGRKIGRGKISGGILGGGETLYGPSSCLPFLGDIRYEVNSDNNPKGGETSLPFPFVAIRGCCALMFAISRRYQNPISSQPASKEQTIKDISYIGSPAGIIK